VRGSQMPLMYSVSLSKVAVIVASMAKLTSMKWPASDICEKEGTGFFVVS
jgi:hypothetical protein